ncbi:hypothetical protein BKA62DRAFT_317703 [Auriculariales sp. MPI-PUGE-AT-0066]|nr:hypothetical protein BKA62DRAFT_317703 [Auriculariales sp. MPI-PUGE-AT-0066]
MHSSPIPSHACESCGAISDVKRDDASFVEVTPPPLYEKPDTPEDTAAALLAEERASTPLAQPESRPPAPRVQIANEDDAVRLVLTVPFSGDIRRFVHQLPQSITFRVKRIVQALILVFLMGFAAFILRFIAFTLGVALRIVAFGIGNWLTRIIVFFVVAFNRPHGLNGRF